MSIASDDLSPKKRALDKRVSFGSSKGSFVETVIFDSTDCDVSFANDFSERRSERPASRVRVSFHEGHSPQRILPSLISEPSEKLINSVPETLPAQQPSSYSMDEVEVGAEENPFRPDGNLNHEVDPIVETYKRRPFPASPSNEMFKSAHANDVSEPPTFVENAKSSPPKKDRGSNKKKSSKGDSPKKKVTPPQTGEHPTTAAVQHHTLASPQTGKVELVHLDEKPKRRCACCTIQ